MYWAVWPGQLDKLTVWQANLCIANMPGKADIHTYIQILYMSAEAVYILYTYYIICILPESIYKSYVCVCLYVPISFH